MFMGRQYCRPGGKIRYERARKRSCPKGWVGVCGGKEFNISQIKARKYTLQHTRDRHTWNPMNFGRLQISSLYNSDVNPLSTYAYRPSDLSTAGVSSISSSPSPSSVGSPHELTTSMSTSSEGDPGFSAPAALTPAPSMIPVL